MPRKKGEAPRQLSLVESSFAGSPLALPADDKQELVTKRPRLHRIAGRDFPRHRFSVHPQQYFQPIPAGAAFPGCGGEPGPAAACGCDHGHPAG